MTRPGNNLLQFASRSSERGKTERVGGTVEGHGITSLSGRERVRVAGTTRKSGATGENYQSASVHVDWPGSVHDGSEYQASPADSLWPSSHFNFHHKRPNGTFVNGPRLEYEVTGVLVRAVITVVVVAALAASCSWLLNRFLEAETAIIHSISSKGGK